MNHDEDDNLCMFDPGSWHIALLCLLLAMVIMLAGVALKEVL